MSSVEPAFVNVGFVEEIRWFALLTFLLAENIERCRLYAQWILGLSLLLFAVDL